MMNEVSRAEAMSACDLPERLFMHPVIHVGEAAMGFLTRVANKNGITFSRLKQLGVMFDPAILAKALSWDRVAPPDSSVQYIAKLAELRRAVPAAWLSAGARCCPLCLQEQQYWSSEWELRQYVACTIHKCWLTDRCSACNEKISWVRKSLLRCDCGATFADGQSTSAPSKVIKLSALVASKLRDTHDEPTPFDALSLKDVTEMLMWFAKQPSDAILGARRSMPRFDDMHAAISLLEPCAEAFSNWPSGYLAYLGAMHRDRGDEAASISTTFADIHRYLGSIQQNKGFEALVAWYQRYLIDNWPWPVLERRNELLNAIASRMNWMWAAGAARVLNVKERKIRELASTGLIESKSRTFTKGRVLLAVRRDELPKMRQALQDQATTRASRSLGISHRRQSTLVPLLFPTAQYREIGWFFPQVEIRNVLRIADDLSVVDSINESQVALHRVLRSCAWSNAMLERLFRLILRGEVNPQAVLRDTSGFTGWLFDRGLLDRIQKGGSE